MRYGNVAIDAVGYVLPPEVVTSDAMESVFSGTLRRLGLPPGQVEKLSGVRERRWWEPDTKPSVVSTMAAERALAKASMSADDVQVLVNTSVSRDYLEPATAALIAGQLGVGRHCMSFDITNACLGFLNGMLVAANMIELGQADNALITCGECTREGVQATLQRLAHHGADVQTFRDNFASLTLGSTACEPGLPELTPEEGEGVARIAEPAAAELLRTLVGRLTGAMEEGGAVAAIEFCSMEALPLTRRVEAGLEGGLGLKRTSFRIRNPANAPDEAEEAALLYFEEAIQSGREAPSSFVQRVSETELRYYKPLFLGEVCLQCHGDPVTMDDQVRELLLRRYPQDLATGYTAGDFRGVVRVKELVEEVGQGSEG